MGSVPEVQRRLLGLLLPALDSEDPEVAYLSPIFRSSLYCPEFMPGLDLIEAVPLHDHNARGAFNGRDVVPRRQDAAAGSFERFLHKRDILFHVALEIGHLDLGDEKDWSGVLGAEPLDRGDAKPKTRQDLIQQLSACSWLVPLVARRQSALCDRWRLRGFRRCSENAQVPVVGHILRKKRWKS